jgi:hypothetical protein
VSDTIQFNFELPEEEAQRVLDEGISRRMGLSRATVSKAMIARALVLERLEQIAPRPLVASSEIALLIDKLTAALRENPALKAELDEFLRSSKRHRRARTAA